ncbi:MAG: protease HtpX, partial [Metallosphaera sp.]
MSFSVVGFKLKMWAAVLGVLLLGFALALGVAGLVFGFKNAPYMVTGILIFLAFMTFFQWLLGPYLINLMYRAVEVTPQDPQYGWLYDLVNEVAAYNRIPSPKVYIADVPF